MPLTYAAEAEPEVGGRLTYDVAPPQPQRTGEGMWDAIVSGSQGAGMRLLTRGRLPDVVLDHTHATWYEKALEATSGTITDLPLIVGGGIVGAATRGGPMVAGAVGSAVPTLVRESLMRAYQRGDVDSSADWLTRTGIVMKGLGDPEVAKLTAKSAAVGAATMGMGMLVGRMAAPFLSETGTAVARTGAEIGTMAVAPAALEGRLPEWQDVINASIVVGGLKAAGHIAGKVAEIYVKTGIRPEQVVADAKADPVTAVELKPTESPIAGQPIWQHMAIKPISGLENRPMWFSQPKEGEPGFYAEADVTGTLRAQLLFRNPFVESKAALGDFEAINKAWKANGLDAREQASFLEDAKYEFGAHMVPGLQRAMQSLGYDGVIADKSWKQPWAIAFDPTKSVRVISNTRSLPSVYQPLATAEAVRNAFPGDKAEQVLDQPYANIPEARVPYTLNLKFVTGPDEIRALLAKMTEVYGTEGKLQSHAETEAKADALLNDMTGGERAKMVTGYEPGSAANAVQLKVRGDMLMQASIEAAAAVKTYNEAKASGTATDQMKLDALDALNKSAMIQAEFTGGLTESARATQYASRFKELRVQSERIKELVDMYGRDPELLLRMAGEVDTPAGMAQFAKDATKATKWEMVIEAYKAGIIGPISQMANIIGNTTFLGFHDVVDALAVFRPGGQGRAVEIPARLFGELQGAYEGLKIAADFLGENWKQPMVALRKLDQPAIKMEQHRQAIPGDLGVLVRSLSFPWLSVADGAARLILERREVNAMAARKAANEGWNPLSREFRESMAAHAQNLSIAEQAEVAAYVQRGVFQNPLGQWGKKLQSVVSESKVGPLFIPFMQTPSNVFKEMARLTPLSAPLVEAWQVAYKEGGVARDRAIAEVVVGSAVMGLTAALAFDGERITGFGPPDPDKRRVWMETHQPYSWKVGSTYHDYSRIQPIGTLIGLAADMSSIWKHMTPDEQDKIPKMISIAFSQAVTNQIWLRGLVDIARGVAESDRYGPKIVQNLAASMMPASGWLGQTAALMDPYVREVNSILEAIRNKIPVAREGLQPMVSGMTGEPIKERERLGFVLPIKEQKESEDKVLLEAARLGVGIAKAPKNIEMPAFGDRKLGALELTPEQRTLFSTTSGKLAHEILTKIVSSPNWERMPDIVKKRVYTTVLTEARKVGAQAAIPAEQRITKAREIAGKIGQQLNRPAP